jgi:flagellar basal body-associated protein FliL
MADTVTLASVNPFAKVGSVGSMGSMGSIILIIVLAIVVIALIGFLIYWRSVKKAYWINIHVFRLIGNVPTRTAIYSAREIPFGMAGDKLWKVAPHGMMKLKTIKWLPVGKIQTAPREFWYYIREDGEWINFSLSDLNDIQRKAGVRFVQEDMRLQRLATERLLEQRLMNKSFWEKWGTTIMMIIVFLVVAICMVLIFFQFGKLMDKFMAVEDTQYKTAQILLRTFGENYINQAINGTGGGTGLIPA